MAELSVGDRLPFCVGVGVDGSFYSSDGQAGRPAILLLGGRAPAAALEAVATALITRQAAIAGLEAEMFRLLDFSALGRLQTRSPAGAGILRTLLCADEFFVSCGLAGDGAVLVAIDRAGRVVHRAVVGAVEADVLAAEMVRAIERLPTEPARDCRLPAPVLAIPGLLDADLCRSLIERFEAGETFDSGVSGTGPDGLAQDRLDAGRKCRRDCLLEPGDDLHDRVLASLARRCVPDMRRAFQYEADQVDRILIARYDAGVGLFKRHRDNTAPAVASRRFALSVNLNAGEFEGGHLLFAEFNDDRYRPRTGEGLVFSASLLHEATRVLSGQRFVLLTFFVDQSAGGPAKEDLVPVNVESFPVDRCMM